VRKILSAFILVCLVFRSGAQETHRLIKLSALIDRQVISLCQPLFLKDHPIDFNDTIRLDFQFQNDLPHDTTIYFAEGINEWVHFEADCIDQNCRDIRVITGFKFIGKKNFDYIYYAAQPLLMEAGKTYACRVFARGNAFHGVDTSILLLTEGQYYQNKNQQKDRQSAAVVINYIFLSIVLFSFLFFLTLYIQTGLKLFGWYLGYLFFQLLYGYLLVDITDWVGSILVRRVYWESFLSEPLIFLGQAVYLYFVVLWLKVRENHKRQLPFFYAAIIFFIAYVAVFLFLYALNRHNAFLGQMMIAVRLISVIIQAILFYLLIFRIKTSGRGFIIAGSFLLVILGVVAVFILQTGGFVNTPLAHIGTGAWYMLGITAECICFSMGMAQYYYLLQKENAMLQVEKLKARELHLEAEEQKLNDRLRISQDLHDSIGSTLSSISVYSQVAQKLNEKNEKEEMNETLGKISATSNEMVSEMNDIVWAINPKNDSMERVIQRMESYAGPLLASRNTAFELEYEPSVITANISMEKRKNLYLVFKEVIHNAYKYSGCSRISVKLGKAGNLLCMYIRDDGVGFDVDHIMSGARQSLSGNGLGNMRRRAEEMKGKFTISSQPGNGTRVEVEIPIP
jgi:signal transduction histidine kinase